MQAFVRNESLWKRNDGTLFLGYQEILAFSDIIIGKLVESESGFEKKWKKNEQNLFSRQYSGIFLQRKHSPADSASELELREFE